MKAKQLVAILLFCAPLLSGCWDKVELNELGIVNAIAIDKANNGDYLITVQLLSPSEIASQYPSNRVTAITYQATGKTILEAIRKLSTSVSRRLYFAHLRIFIFGETMAQEGIRKSLDFFYRDHELRTDFYLLVAKHSTGANILHILTPLEKIPANKIYGSLKYSQDNWAPTRTVTIDDLLDCILTPGKEPVLTGIEIEGNPRLGKTTENIERMQIPAVLKLTDLAVFKRDRLIGWLNESESKGYNKITNHVAQTVEYVNCREGKATFEISNLQTKIKSKIVHNKPMMDIHVSGAADIDDMECKLDLNNFKNVYMLEDRLNKKLKTMLVTTVKGTQERLNSDIFGFGDILYHHHPHYWRQVEPRWDETFPETKVQVTVDIQVRRLGTIIESFQ
ncbi:spore germination protein KC [Pullulanibacillus camelliae]|uniref:Spore germination protein KC n=1 Tax=Pullulanibacillus camelliae TaxID=1707096 RepID=A0A8J2YG49_9BACL|nr:Ger(x)C family spore germination protein [Pullulanibacillus camelliae]GGE33524.1 spore germination protein KC [Pullulanibacillus camelliae]